MKYVVFPLIFLVLLITLPVEALSASVGKFTYVKGRVDITSPGQPARDAASGEAVNLSDIIRSKSKAKAEITFLDGSILRLSQNTRIKITKYIVQKDQTHARLHLLRGKVRSKVKKIFGRFFGRIGRNRYEVHTPTAVMGVRGTDFIASHIKGVSEAVFREGNGYCFSKNRPKGLVYIKPGQAAKFLSADHVPSIKTLSKMEMGLRFRGMGSPGKPGEDNDTSKGTDDKFNPDDSLGDDSGDGSQNNGVSSFTSTLNSDITDVYIPPKTPGQYDEENDDNQNYYTPPTTWWPGTTTTTSTTTTIRTTTTTTSTTATSTTTSTTETSTTTSSTETSSTTTTTIPEPPPGITGNGNLDLNFFGTGDSATVTASFNEGQDRGTLTLAGQTASLFPDTWTGSISGSMNDGSVFKGYTPGISASLHMLLSCIYIEEDGDAGYLIGYLAGERNPDDGILSGAGDIGIEELSGRGLTPGDLDTLLKDWNTFTHMIPVISGIDAGLSMQSNESDVEGRAIEGITLDSGVRMGVWQITTSGGIYSNTNNLEEWSQAYGKYGKYNNAGKLIDYYMLGDALFTDNGSDFVELIDDDISYLDQLYSAGIPARHIGTYDTSGNYISAAADHVTLYPLAFSGKIEDAADYTWRGGPYLSIFAYDNFYEEFRGVADSTGLIGGEISPWTQEGMSAIKYMGEYNSFGEDLNLPYIWNNNLYSYNSFNNKYTTYDNGAFYGFIGGVWDNSGIDQWRVAALYCDPDGKIGFLSGGFGGGKLYPDLSMYKSDGIWAPYTWMTPVEGSGILPEDFYNSVQTDDEMYSKIFGKFDVDNGYISGTGSSDQGWDGWTRYIDGESWGLYDLIFDGYNGFVNPDNDTVWSAKAGSNANLGSYYSDHINAYDKDRGYWIADITGDIWEGHKLSGNLEGRFLTFTKIGDMTGDIIGYYDDSGNWAASSMGFWASRGLTESDELVFSSEVTLTDDLPGAILGSTRTLWNEISESVYMMGEYAAALIPQIWHDDSLISYNPYNNTDTTFDNGAYEGFIGGTRIDNNIESIILTVYIDTLGNAGILAGDLSCTGYPDIDMFDGEGEILAVKMSPDIGILSENLNVNLNRNNTQLSETFNGWFFDGVFHVGDIACEGMNIETLSLNSETWNIKRILSEGTYTQTTYNEWEMPFNYKDQDVKYAGNIAGNKWSDNQISGAGYGAWTDPDAALTGIAGGKIAGTFDPNNFTWKSVEMWTSMDTKKFMEMAVTETGRAKLTELYIPCVEIGLANLSGQSALMNVNMNNVKFFAYSTGAAPRIWSTGNITGTYSAAPNGGHMIDLAGDGLNAGFSVNQWNGARWGADIINGSGTLNRTDTGKTVDINFSGGAAGNINSANKTFSGTASGTASE